MTEEAKKQAFEKVSNSIADITQNNYSTDLLIYSKGFDAGYQVAMDEANDKIYHATRKVPELEYEKEHLRLTLLSECKNHKYSLDRIDDLKERIQELREALTYYACDNKRQGPDFITVELHEMILDNGKRARAALKEDDLNK